MNSTIHSVVEKNSALVGSSTDGESVSNYKLQTLNRLHLEPEVTQTFGFPDSFALILTDYVVIQYKS
jgi:hypothetical protein